MKTEHAELDARQRAYRLTVESWIVAIHEEEVLASGNHSVAQVDRWERAHGDEERARAVAKNGKREYEDALRAKFFAF